MRIEKAQAGWKLLNGLTKPDNDRVMEAIGLMADGYDDTRIIPHLVPFREVGKKIAALGYAPIDQVPQKVRDLANDKHGTSEAHKSAFACCVAGNYMGFPHPMAEDFAKEYFQRFGDTRVEKAFDEPTRGTGKPTFADGGNASPKGGPGA